MSRASTLILLGFFTVLAPFSGLPISIRSLLTVIFGVSVLGIGLSLRTNTPHAPASTVKDPEPLDASVKSAPVSTLPRDVSSI